MGDAWQPHSHHGPEGPVSRSSRLASVVLVLLPPLSLLQTLLHNQSGQERHPAGDGVDSASYPLSVYMYRTGTSMTCGGMAASKPARTRLGRNDTYARPRSRRHAFWKAKGQVSEVSQAM